MVSRTTGPISTKLGTKHLIEMGILVSNEGTHPLQRGDKSGKAKIHVSFQRLKILVNMNRKCRLRLEAANSLFLVMAPVLKFSLRNKYQNFKKKKKKKICA